MEGEAEDEGGGGVGVEGMSTSALRAALKERGLSVNGSHIYTRLFVAGWLAVCCFWLCFFFLLLHVKHVAVMLE